jgi:hypothetical protein
MRNASELRIQPARAVKPRDLLTDEERETSEGFALDSSREKGDRGKMSLPIRMKNGATITAAGAVCQQYYCAL